MSENQQNGALPGFEELVRTTVDRAGSQDLSAKQYTAANVLRDYPETFRSVAAAIFKYNLPNRVIRELYHMNGATVKGIHDMVLGACSTDGRGAFLVKCRAASAKSIIQSRLLDSIIDKLDDPDVLKKMTVEQLTNILLAIEPHEDSDKDKVSSGKTIQVVEPEKDFEAIINGLVSEKRRALDDPAGDTPAAVVECGAKRSTENDSTGDNSLKMSHTRAKTLGVDGGLCNPLCNQSAAGGRDADPSADTPAAPSAAKDPPGAGGPPGALADGGLT